MSARYVKWSALWFLLSACSADKQSAQTKTAKPDSAAGIAAARVAALSAPISPDTANRSLVNASGVNAYRVDSTLTTLGALSVQVLSTNPFPSDTTVRPDFATTKCRPFLDATFPPRRGAKNNSVGNAIVWLVGVAAGPGDESSKRVNIRLEKCQLQPRVQRVPVGATLNAFNRDDFPSDLRFADIGQAGTRATLRFSESGQVIPLGDVLAKPGLLEVRDLLHPWLRSYIAVAPHPFVTVTGADGKITWDDVPAGSYQLVVWHERLGARVLPIVVKQGERLELKVEY
ncbi:MAG: hypothetical protein ABJB66_01615 [Gemmatimonadaceae bacterium]